MSPRDGARSTHATTTAPNVSRIPRCGNTLLTKPECHCLACLSEQIAEHGRHGVQAQPQAR
jgi:hypothetical protein